MTPRPRYLSLQQRIGDPWLSYTLTASDQVHVSTHPDELVRVLNVTNALVPAVVALLGNSSVYTEAVASGQGQGGPFCSGREGLMGGMRHAFPHRHGMPEKVFASLEDWTSRMCDHTDFVVDPGSARSFQQLIAEGDMTFADFLSHEKSVFHSSRPRALTGTIEQRSGTHH